VPAGCARAALTAAARPASQPVFPTLISKSNSRLSLNPQTSAALKHQVCLCTHSRATIPSTGGPPSQRRFPAPAVTPSQWRSPFATASFSLWLELLTLLIISAILGMGFMFFRCIMRWDLFLLRLGVCCLLCGLEV